jgi:hypothetical protein
LSHIFYGRHYFNQEEIKNKIFIEKILNLF